MARRKAGIGGFILNEVTKEVKKLIRSYIKDPKKTALKVGHVVDSFKRPAPAPKRTPIILPPPNTEVPLRAVVIFPEDGSAPIVTESKPWAEK